MRYCPSRSKGTLIGSLSLQSLVCFECGQYGHWKDSCPNRSTGGVTTSLADDEQQGATEIIVDNVNCMGAESPIVDKQKNRKRTPSSTPDLNEPDNKVLAGPPTFAQVVSKGAQPPPQQSLPTEVIPQPPPLSVGWGSCDKYRELTCCPDSTRVSWVVWGSTSSMFVACWTLCWSRPPSLYGKRVNVY